MNDEFEFSESSASSFDLKKFLFRALSYWKLFVLLFVIGAFVVYQKNIREEFSYRLGSKISVEDDSNPIISSTANLTFNWGGVGGKVQTTIVTLQSRSHHEKVVDHLAFYKCYLRQGRFKKQDIYKAAPFRFDHTLDYGQLLNTPIKITILNEKSYALEVEFLNPSVSVQNYQTKLLSRVAVPVGVFKREFQFGDVIALPFLKGVIRLEALKQAVPGAIYFIQFKSFDGVVASYRARTSVSTYKNSSILDISLVDKNTEKIVDYLNALIALLVEEELDRKNQYATNAIQFIDDQISRVKGELSENAAALNNYRKENKIYSLDEDNVILHEKLSKLDAEKELITRQLNYYYNLQNYLKTSESFTDIPAPSVAGIADGNILNNVSRINELSVQKSKLQYSVRDNASVFNDLDRQIDALKNVLQENINAAISGVKRERQTINYALNQVDNQFNKLPEEKQHIITIQRQYMLSEHTYNAFLSKRGEAEIMKASNVSDILVIDPAKNTGAQLISTNLNIRYVFVVLASLLTPLLLAFLLTLLDNKIHNPTDLEQLSPIPILGIVGKNILDNNLAVHRNPKSSVSEAFRTIRSNLQFFYKGQDSKGAKTVLITSSISGEGKTFCSINTATVFALSGKKTVLVGLDLRKPKIFKDFNIENDLGVVNYLIGQKLLDTVIQKTKVPNLDVITSGPIPPNPSELLLSEKLDELIRILKVRYDYIVLDTPPIGLVADALELLEYVDASLYVVRQDFTKNVMLNFINEKYKTKQIKNISLVYNGYERERYGYDYDYDYGYGNAYGNYTNEGEALVPKSRLERWKERLQSLFKK